MPENTAASQPCVNVDLVSVKDYTFGNNHSVDLTLTHHFQFTKKPIVRNVFATRECNHGI